MKKYFTLLLLLSMQLEAQNTIQSGACPTSGPSQILQGTTSSSKTLVASSSSSSTVRVGGRNCNTAGNPFPFLSDLYQKINSPVAFNSDTTELVDSLGNENMILSNSGMMYSAAGYFVLIPQTINLDNDFKIEFYTKNSGYASYTGKLFNKLTTYGIDFSVKFPTNTTIRIAGSTKSLTATTISSNIPTDRFVKVTIERTSSNLYVSYNDTIKNTISLSAYGSIDDTTHAKIYISYDYLFDYRVYQPKNTLIVHYPFSEGVWDKTTGVYNSVGANGQLSNGPINTNYPNASNFNLTNLSYTQDIYHYNFKTGFSAYIANDHSNAGHQLIYRLPYKNGSPQAISHSFKLGTYAADSFSFVGNFSPGLSTLVETKVKLKSNHLSLTDTSTWVNASLQPKGVSYKYLFSSGDNKIFISKGDSINPGIYTYNTAKSASEIKTIKNYIGSDTLEIIFLSGQSNAQSRADDATTTPYKVYNRNVWLWNSTAKTIMHAITNVGDHNNPTTIGNHSLSLPLYQMYANDHRKILIIQFAVGNTPIYNDGTNNNWNVARAGGLYPQWLTIVTEALTYLQVRDIPYKFKCLIWFQGERDAGVAAYYPTYKQNTIDLFAGFRTHIGYNIPIYMGKISTSNGTYSANVRADQVAMAGGEVANCTLINTDTFSYEADNIHLSPTGKIQFATAVYNLIK